MSEKTEKPTAKKLRDARQKGQVVKSQEIGAAMQLGLILLWMLGEGPALQSALGQLVTAAIDACNLPLDVALPHLAGLGALLLLRFVFGLAGLLVLALTLTNMLQVGFLVAPEALKPSAGRLNPLSNLKNMFSAKTLFELFKMLLKVSVLGLTFLYLFKRHAASFAHLPHAGLAAGMALCVELGRWMWTVLVGFTACFSVVDYAMQHRQLHQQLMMSRQDIKQEYKDAEGNPEVKQRRREVAREVQSGSLDSKVAKSSVVVRNPTHIAVCLRFVAGETPLPVVLEYGRDAQAQQIVALAERLGVPVVENIPLARALIAATAPGDYVPEPLFQAVAQVLRVVSELLDDDEDGQP